MMSLLSFLGTVWSGSTLYAIINSLIGVYTVCHSQQSDQNLQYLPFSAVWSESTIFAILSLIRVKTICHSRQSDQGVHYLPFSAVWSGSKQFAIVSEQYYEVLFSILSSLIKVNVYCHSQDQSHQGLHCLPFSAVWSGSTLFAIRNLIKVYTIFHSQYDQGLHHLPFSVWSGSTPFAILSILIKVCTVILSSLIRVYTNCHSQQSDQGQGPKSYSGTVW